MTLAGRAVRRVTRAGWAHSLLRRIAAVRGYSVVLVYHRVGPPGGGAVPTISEELFATQIRLLKELGPVVDAPQLLRDPAPGEVRFALTFDDDYRSHLERVVPILVREGITGTFFLSGRSLFGLGPYPFETLDHLLRSHSAEGVARLLGIEAGDADDILKALLSDPDVAARAAAAAPGPGYHLGSDQIAQLAAAGMKVGFHTLEHNELGSLADERLRDAVCRGRDELRAASGSEVDLFAYPYGRGDPRVARAVKEAGYSAAFTGIPGPVTRRTDPYLVPRWEPGPLGETEFVAEIAIRLLRRARA